MLRKIVLRDDRASHWLVFENPVDVLWTRDISEVTHLLAAVEARVNDEQLIAAGYLSYEAASAFDPALHTQTGGQLPLLCFGLFNEPRVLQELPEPDVRQQQAPPWQPATSWARYQACIDKIQSEIALGNTYQINYTFRQTAHNVHDAWQLFLHIAHAPYGAYVELDTHSVVSASPELFFRLDGDRIVCKPMKGTAPRGTTLVDDRAARETLRNSAKNLAENVMITDMMRNDLGRIAEPGSVVAESLFAIEKYPTVWQMVSTVRARSAASIASIFAALFPCASITGAPKAASMRLIAALEEEPREVYTGSIGFLRPGREAQFSVAIRTSWIDSRSGTARYGVGGGIVWDSNAEDEYRECVDKSRVLLGSYADRGFELLETLRWDPANSYFLLAEHLERLRDSAEYFDFSFDRAAIVEALAQLEQSFTDEHYRVRLLLDRNGTVRTESRPLQLPGPATQYRVKLAATPVDASNPFLYHKTTQRDLYERARAAHPEFDDVLLWNKDGYLTETTVANIIVELDGELCTPPVNSGLLNGTFRQQLVDAGRLIERPIHRDELGTHTSLRLINSVRGEFTAELHR